MKPTMLTHLTQVASPQLRGLARAVCALALIVATASAVVPRGAQAPSATPVAAGDTDVPVYVINDSVSQVNPFTMKDIGLIDIVQPDSALAHYGSRNVIRVYTREFVRQHPARFPGVPVIAPDTIPGADTAPAGGGH
jgi:hypothetical protein